ncbi:hypothetical protein PV328_011406 [Microctonus aethiopoides]|uniref:Lysosomal acid phosphatase n=1 Tax=Microctonus aethiopoides TaxID=144406 RepID=A0AA39C4D7_9HYME|nr:hypothetical protein PV328_011406 [Microctonus aethiopoides]
MSAFIVTIFGILMGSLIVSSTSIGHKEHRNSLQQVAIIFRHGDRTPTETYPNDPYVNYTWEDGWGSLTKRGMLQLYNLGAWLRNEYDSLIDKKFKSSQVQIKSSYADRCIMSAQALLAGLFPPIKKDKFINDLSWRPVPVQPIPRNLDKLITVKHHCPKLDNALKEAYMNESKRSDKQLASYYKQLSFYTGKKIKTITDVEFLYNTLEIEDNNNLKLPEWTRQFYNETMREIAAKSLAIFTSNKLQRRLRGGPLLKEITNNMMRARNGQDKKKLYLYSAHDVTIVNVLRAMGFTNQLLKPEYGAALIFELVVAKDTKQNPELDVKVKYLNNTQIDMPITLEIPGCKNPCKLLDLLTTWNDILPTNWEAECST